MGREGQVNPERGCSCAVLPSLAGSRELLWVSPGRSQVRTCVAHLLHLCTRLFRLQNFRGRKASGPSTKASSCTTPLTNLRARASTQTQRVPSVPDCGRANCRRTTTGPLMSMTSHGSGTESPSQLWQVRSQGPCAEMAADPHSRLTFGKGSHCSGACLLSNPQGFV